MRVKALMVDVDGVVVAHPDPKGWSVHLERDLGLSADLLQEAFFVPHFNDIVHGRTNLDGRLKSVLAQIAPHLSSETLIRYWFEQDAYLDQDLLAQLSEFRNRGLKLHLVTVQEHMRADYLWQTLELHKQFDAMHYAADIGWAKPATEFYGAVEERTGFAPEEMFFIDDKIPNVEAARVRGWHAALWTGKRRLADLMNEAGL
jgi:putative hydrolase of the HAD superfamily